ncbi:MAG: hypothetical protein HQL96_06575 [Magnetococcales bacterium]|nr:hypothetical protein [Magnetococcales bacterium]
MTPLPSAGRFFTAAALHLALTGIVLIVRHEEWLQTPLDPATVATAHLYLLGVLTMALFGAVYHLLPRWTGNPVPWPRLVPWVWGWLIAGALSVYLGIGTSLHRWFLLLASAGVGVAFGIFLAQTLWMALRPGTAGHPLLLLARIALLSLTGVLALGAIFLGEYAHGFLPYDRLAMVGSHLTWGLFGWAGVMLMAMRLSLAAPAWTERQRGLLRLTAAGAVASLLLIPVGLFRLPEEPGWLWLTMAPGAAAMLTLTLAARRAGGGNRYWDLADLAGAGALLSLLTWPVSHAAEWRFLFGLLWLPGWSLSQLYGLYAAWRPGRLGRLHLMTHASGLLLLLLALPTNWSRFSQGAGALLLISALLFLAALREKPQT